MSGTRAYITQVADDAAELAVYDGVTMYGGRADKEPVLSEQYTLEDDGVDYVMGAEPGQPYEEADRILAANGFKRDGVWLVGDAVTGICARVPRA